MNPRVRPAFQAVFGPADFKPERRRISSQSGRCVLAAEWAFLGNDRTAREVLRILARIGRRRSLGEGLSCDEDKPECRDCDAHNHSPVDTDGMDGGS